MEISFSKSDACKKFFFLLILFVQIYEYALFNALSTFKVIDELIAAFGLFYLLLNITVSRKRFLKQEGYLFLWLSIIILIGSISNLIFKYQPFKAVISDMIIFAKPIFGYFLGRLLLYDINLNTLKKPINTFCKLSSVILFGAILLNMFTGIFPTYDYRFFLYSQELFFGHPTFLGSTCIVIICLLIGIRSHENKSNKFYIILTMFVAAATFRFKILVFLLFCPLLIYYSWKKRQINKFIFVFIVIAGFIFSFQQIKYYYISHSDFARSALTVTSIRIANDHFPWGAGFATYGSHQSAVYYSPVYQKYSLAHIWGISRTYFKFISDTFWPMIIGQFGYIGLMSFIFFILTLLSLLGKLRQISFEYYYSALAFIIYLLITSTAESSFVQPYSVLFFYIIGAYTSQLRYSSELSSYLERQVRPEDRTGYENNHIIG